MNSTVNWLHLAGAIPYMLVLGVVMSFSPTTYGITVHALVRDKDAVRAVRWIALGLRPLRPFSFFFLSLSTLPRWLKM